MFRKAETIHLFCGSQLKCFFFCSGNWEALRSIHQRLKPPAKWKEPRKGFLYPFRQKNLKQCHPVDFFCLNLCQICFISSPEVSVWEMLLFFSFMLFNFFPREKSLTLRELAFPLFLRWKIFDHFQLLYTIGEKMGNSYSYRIELRNFQDTYGVLQNFGHVCLPATTLESQSWYVLPAYSFILDSSSREKDWNKCLVFFGCKIQKKKDQVWQSTKKDPRKVLGVH